MNDRITTLYSSEILYVSSKLVYDDGVVSIQGFDGSGKSAVEVSFPDVLLVRVTEEGGRLRLLRIIEDRKALICLHEESELVAWYSDENLSIRDVSDVKHFILLIGEEIIDVLSLSMPSVNLK